MPNDTQNTRDQSTVELVTGIIEDAQRLIMQQMELTRHEIVRDVTKVKEAAWFYTIGAGFLLISGIMFSVGLAVLIHWATSPAGTDSASIPLWGCFAGVGAVLASVGGSLMGMGSTKYEAIHPMESPAGDAMKKNVEWAKHPTSANALNGPQVN